MKTIKILGMGRVSKEKNGITRTEYFDALEKVSKWNDLAPYQADQAMLDKKKELN